MTHEKPVILDDSRNGLLLHGRCASCLAQSKSGVPPLGWANDEGFTVHWPVCGHGKYLLCKECSASCELPVCPTCAVTGEYT